MTEARLDKTFVCHLCSQTCLTRQGLKIHCQRQAYRRRQSPAESTVASLQDSQNPGPSHGQDHQQELPRGEDHGSANHLLNPEGQQEDCTAEPAEGANARGEAARLQTANLAHDTQPAVLNYSRTLSVVPVPAPVARLFPLLLNLSAADRDLLLKVIKHKDFTLQLVPWESSNQLHSFLDKNWVTTDASASDILHQLGQAYSSRCL